MNNSTSVQTWDPAAYARDAGFVAKLGQGVLPLLAPRAGERILDLGCGDGALTQLLAQAGCEVVGVDASAEQVAAARQLGLDARVVSAQELDFDEEFDAVFSNATLHWVKPPERAIANVWRALRPGGRFVAEFGGAGNVASIVAAMGSALGKRGISVASVHPWYFPTAEEYAALLEQAGFQVEHIALFARPTPLPTGMRAWVELFGHNFLHPVDAEERATFLDEVEQQLAPAMRDAQGNWTADYWRLRVAARKPA